MKKFHFHVGSERCGSTLVQSFFNEPSVGQILQRFGIRFDAALYLEIGKLLPLGPDDDARLRELRDRCVAGYREEGAPVPFSTHEVFLGLSHAKGEVNQTGFMCACLKTLLSGFEVRPLIVLRRQDTFIESLYNQLLKRGETREFSRFLDELPLDNYRWDRVVDTFAENFGKNSLSVVPFERKVTASAGFDNYLNAIFGALEMPINVDMASVPVMNPSISPRALEVQRLANRLLTPEEAHGLADWLESNVPKRPSDGHALMSDGQRADLIAYFTESNRRLFATYMPAYAVEGYLSA